MAWNGEIEKRVTLKKTVLYHLGRCFPNRGREERKKKVECLLRQIKRPGSIFEPGGKEWKSRKS